MFPPRIEYSGYIVFVLSVCLSLVNFNIFGLTVRDRDFIFCMHKPHDTLSNDTKANGIVTLTLASMPKKVFPTLLPPGIVFHKQILSETSTNGLFYSKQDVFVERYAPVAQSWNKQIQRIVVPADNKFNLEIGERSSSRS